MARVLVACEYSGIVRDAFAAKGHDAWSCDLLPTESPGNHIQGDIVEVLSDQWDLIVGFPPCTDLSASGAQYWDAKRKDGRQAKAVELVFKIYAAAERVSIENPVGILSRIWRKPDQIIHPYYFGDPYMKKTCLWLKGLPKLEWFESDSIFGPRTAVAPSIAWTCGSHRGGPRKDGTRKKNVLPTFHRDPKKRSQSFQGIATAMADQWSDLL